MLMFWRLTKLQTKVLLVDNQANPQTIEVLQTRAEPLGIEIKLVDITADLNEFDYFGLIIQYPNSRGNILDIKPVIEQAHTKKH